ncbi:hypothetical protein PAXRUDRAFT_21628 [Paxillus rubicundulus Ve08.2h10]|uniref:Unplaced genomic scaffold scaffold_5662, whole genome shotgun sequence n=1 Tax=Paxillus rubicundulus Ve08.2h10 TaxID=930991 RepID=A0A0D0D735_9AGAM|nr:hypothetical protein PAXRUDRAFT_21628 [Paxillus rubicundulus Ve08.2h10]
MAVSQCTRKPLDDSASPPALPRPRPRRPRSIFPLELLLGGVVVSDVAEGEGQALVFNLRRQAAGEPSLFADSKLTPNLVNQVTLNTTIDKIQ